MKERKTLNTIAVIIVTVGVLLFLGTAWAFEYDRIDLTQAGLQAFIGLGIAVIGGRLFRATYNPSDYDYEEDDA